jgi:hypothetical protein
LAKAQPRAPVARTDRAELMQMVQLIDDALGLLAKARQN